MSSVMNGDVIVENFSEFILSFNFTGLFFQRSGAGREGDKSTVMTSIVTAGFRTSLRLQHLLPIPTPDHPQPVKE